MTLQPHIEVGQHGRGVPSRTRGLARRQLRDAFGTPPYSAASQRFPKEVLRAQRLARLNEALDAQIAALNKRQQHNESGQTNASDYPDVRRPQPLVTTTSAGLRNEPATHNTPVVPRATPRLEAARLQQETDALRSQAERLSIVRQWMNEDAAFAASIDACISQQVRAAEQRQRLYTAVVTVGTSAISLAIGWLLSAISPAITIAHLLGH